MPGLEFFRQLGLLVVPEFLADGKCRELMDMIAAAPKTRGRVSGGGGTKVVEETVRSVDDAQVPKSGTPELMQSLLDLRPDLERHFRMPLEWGREGPNYLVYRTGDFHKPHADNIESSPAPNSRTLRRQVVIVLFLNRYYREYRDNCFGGGLLNFYGLLDEPQWRNCVFGLEPQPGLLVAFPAGLVHEVTPITFGERYSILTTFHARLSPPQIPG